MEQHCRYYNRQIHRAAFALPNFVQQALAGESPFGKLDEAQRRR